MMRLFGHVVPYDVEQYAMLGEFTGGEDMFPAVDGADEENELAWLEEPPYDESEDENEDAEDEEDEEELNMVDAASDEEVDSDDEACQEVEVSDDREESDGDDDDDEEEEEEEEEEGEEQDRDEDEDEEDNSVPHVHTFEPQLVVDSDEESSWGDDPSRFSAGPAGPCTPDSAPPSPSCLAETDSSALPLVGLRRSLRPRACRPPPPPVPCRKRKLEEDEHPSLRPAKRRRSAQKPKPKPKAKAKAKKGERYKVPPASLKEVRVGIPSGPCPWCGETLVDDGPRVLTKHFGEHIKKEGENASAPGRIKCPACPKEKEKDFLVTSYTRHIRSVHFGDKYRCLLFADADVMCPFTCVRSDEVKRHVETKHPDRTDLLERIE